MKSKKNFEIYKAEIREAIRDKGVNLESVDYLMKTLDFRAPYKYKALITEVVDAIFRNPICNRLLNKGVSK